MRVAMISSIDILSAEVADLHIKRSLPCSCPPFHSRNDELGFLVEGRETVLSPKAEKAPMTKPQGSSIHKGVGWRQKAMLTTIRKTPIPRRPGGESRKQQKLRNKPFENTITVSAKTPPSTPRPTSILKDNFRLHARLANSSLLESIVSTVETKSIEANDSKSTRGMLQSWSSDFMTRERSRRKAYSRALLCSIADV